MRGTYSGLNIIVPHLCTEVRRWLQYVQQTPTQKYLNNLNTLVTQLKSANIFQQLDRFWILAAEQAQHARISIVNPQSTQITEVNAPTFVPNQGYYGDGATKYLNTNFNTSLGTNFKQSSASLGVYNISNIQENGADTGTVNGSTQYTVIHSRFLSIANQTISLLNQSTVPLIPNTDSRGMFSNERNGTARVDYKNGAVTSTGTETELSMPNYNLYILARNNAGTAQFFSTRTTAMAFAGNGKINHKYFYQVFQDFATKQGFAV